MLEEEDVTLSCSFSKPDAKATWLWNGRPIPVDGRYEVRAQGHLHELVIGNVRLEDGGVFKVQIGDADTSAQLSVEGRNI